MRIPIVVGLLAQAVFSAPIDEHVVLRPDENIGIELDAAGVSPILNLPYGRYKGSYDSEHDVRYIVCFGRILMLTNVDFSFQKHTLR